MHDSLLVRPPGADQHVNEAPERDGVVRFIVPQTRGGSAHSPSRPDCLSFFAAFSFRLALR